VWEDRSGRLDHDGLVLLWQQVADDLLDDIRRGVLAPGAKLPNELELAEIYGVSRVTVRTAILNLRNQGYLTVTIGRGTFVSR